MKTRLGRARPTLALSLAVALLAGCGLTEDDGAGDGEAITVGMSDEVLSVDPASGYDPGSWLVFNNVFQSLLSFPPGGTEPQPEAAEECGFTDRASQRYTCTLRDGLTFSNGNALTSKDVKFSFDRTLRIDDPDGPAVMLSTIDRVETPDDRTVTFHLNEPDATFPQKIASGAGSLVDHREYPSDRLRTDGQAVGSGVYTLAGYGEDEVVFEVNDDYHGPAEAKNSGVTMRLFHGDQEALGEAVRGGDVDVAYRGLASGDIAGLETEDRSGTGDLKVVDGTSAEAQYLVFHLDDPVTGDPAVRRAIAQLVDREALVRDVYQRTAEPLYSVVPAGITGHNTAFFDRYGATGDPEAAARTLREAGVTEPVELTLWATPVRFGPDTVAAFEYLADQLNDSGLFEATVESVPAEEFAEGVADGEYGAFVRGWVPDFPDPENFTDPFFGADNVLANGYTSERITGELLPATRQEAARADSVPAFEEVQDIVADEVPLIPLWQGRQYAVADERINGLQWTLDPSTVFRFWELELSEA
ncbi:ABC transporter substrate-binding protein [Streptomyces sedi]|nr:ABC transporter substrate-binding protein [Streptomyces sedi]